MKKKEKILVVLGIIFISFNLRAPITAVGAVVKTISSDYNLSNGMAGFITTLPLIAFAIISPFVANVSRKYGYSKTMIAGLCMMLIGELVRSYTNVIGLFIGTTLIGIGIAIGNVLIPSIIKLKFKHNIGKMTSIYTSSMCLFAAVGAGVSLPLSKNLELGWKNSLATWAILTFITIFIWSAQLKIEKNHSSDQGMAKSIAKKSTSIWKSKTAWSVTVFMGVQSLLFYCMVAWLPTIIISRGMEQSFASNMALLYQVVAIPATLVFPTLCDKFANQRGLIITTCVVYLTGMILFLVADSQIIYLCSVILISLGMGGSISLSIAFISLRSPNAQRASELSGMSQSAGYLLAAVGPTTVGAIYDVMNNWNIPIIIFIALIVVLGVVGMSAGNNVTVKE